MSPGPPRKYRSTPDYAVEKAFNPTTFRADLVVTVDGEKLDFLQRHGIALFQHTGKIVETLQSPDHVGETTDGELLYVKSYGRWPDGSEKVFTVRVRPTGCRAYVWIFEVGDVRNPGFPLASGPDRLRKWIR